MSNKGILTIAAGELQALRDELAGKADEADKLRAERDELAATLETVRAANAQLIEDLDKLRGSTAFELDRLRTVASTEKTRANDAERRCGELETARDYWIAKHSEALAAGEKLRAALAALRNLAAKIDSGEPT